MKTNGFTLIEALLSMALLSILMLAAVEGSKIIMKSAGTADRMASQTLLALEAHRVVGSQASCSEQLVGLPSVSDTDVILSADIQAGGIYDAKLGITQVTLQNVTPIGAGLDRMADIEIIGEKLGIFYSTKVFTKNVKVYYTVDGAATNVIDGCIGDGIDPAAGCQALGGTWEVNPAPPHCVFSTTAYAWETGAWGACDGTNETRIVQCVSSPGNPVAQSNCTEAAPAATQPCGMYSWLTGGWAACNSGSQDRPVDCVDQDQLIVAEPNCTTPKPPVSQTCGSATADWVIGSWVCISCSAAARRDVDCIDSSTGLEVSPGNCPLPIPDWFDASMCTDSC